MHKHITEAELRNAALRYLSQRETSSENLKSVLKRRVYRRSLKVEFNPSDFDAVIDKIVDSLVDLKLIDDDRYAGMLISSMRRSGKSQKQIKSKLSSKGISRESQNTALGNDENSDESSIIRFCQKKKIGPYRNASKEPNIKKELGILARAGFSYDLASKILLSDLDEDNFPDSF